MRDILATVVIPVYNSPHVVRPCLDSVMRWTNLQNNELVIVDDFSDEYTANVLSEFADGNDVVRLIRHPRNLGFVQAANRGFREARGEFTIVLNSDTCVTPRWLDKMLQCMHSDHRIAVASPLANFAPHMAIPMPPGYDYISTAALIEALSERRYPDVTTPEGFCFMVRMSALTDIGPFDPVWRRGYGEESDFSMRARYAGYRTVCVDDTYIYHRGRGTFGQDTRDELYKQSRATFHDRWGPLYRREFAEFKERDPLRYIRERMARLVEDQSAIIL